MKAPRIVWVRCNSPHFLGLSLIIQGVPNPQSAVDTRFATGMLEAHEYFHSLQRIPIMGKTDVWPHAWFREGSAEWVQNMAVNYLDYRAYEYFLKADCIGNCQRLSEADIVEFLEKSYDNYTPAKFDQFLNYSLSSRSHRSTSCHKRSRSLGRHVCRNE